MVKLIKNGQRAFTIVELLIVIVVIGILAAITVVSYRGIVDNANNDKIKADFDQLQKAIMIARHKTGGTLRTITGSNYTAGNCTSHPDETDLAALSKSDSCWSVYLTTLSRISNASGVRVDSMVDPWGRPYRIDENEGENSSCGRDQVAVYTQPFTSSGRTHETQIPLSGNSGCSV